MKILTGNQIKDADRYTINFEPIRSIDLMERAAKAISRWFSLYVDNEKPLLFFIGKGNNGGDGLAVARMLYNAGYKCTVCLPFDKLALSEENLINLMRLPEGVLWKSPDEIGNVSEETIIIDALLGTNVQGEVKEPFISLIHKINKLDNYVVSIDLPSGMKNEFGNKDQVIVEANKTLALGFPKLAMLLPEAGEYCGNIIPLDIGLDKHYFETTEILFHFITEIEIIFLLKDRNIFSHKGTYGHALLICGSKGMIGSAVLATGAALRSGCGLVTTHLPENERMAVQVNYPSVMLSLDENECFSELPQNLEKYNAIGIGCGLGQAEETKTAFEKLLKSTNNPVVIDADALNILASRKELQKHVPKNSILTPHPGELKRLIGEWKDEEEKIKQTRELAARLQSIIIVKGAYTMIVLPDGNVLFNSTGNSGMAKGGSGDVLTGFITGLLARGYSSEQAAILGVYYHGSAGDETAIKYGQEAMNSFDLIKYLNL